MALVTTQWQDGQTGTGSTDYLVQFDLQGNGSWEEMCFTAFTEDMGYVVEQIQDFCMQAQANIVTAISPTWSGDLLLRFGGTAIDLYKRRFNINQVQNIPMRIINSLVQSTNEGPATDPSAEYEVITTTVTITAMSNAIEAATFMTLSVTVGLFDGNFTHEFLTRDQITGGTTSGAVAVSAIDLTVQAGDTQNVLSWNRPADGVDSNGQTIQVTGYQIYSDGGVSGATMTVIQTITDPSIVTYTNTGLTNGTEYSYEIYATTGTGSSVADIQTSKGTSTGTPASSTAVTAPTTAPTNVAATAADSGASIAFDTVTGATSYDVVATPSGGTAMTAVNGTSSPISLTGLTNGTEYSVTVTAKNSAGSGPASTAVTVTPTATP